MRPLRFLLSLAACITAFVLLIVTASWRETAQLNVEQQGSIGTYLNWRTPSSLFPPQAVVSLTDENSTIFMARPANFGPLLPATSMSGELWIGSGFGEDRLGRPGAAEGELGCSDVPGWSDNTYASIGQSLSEAKSSWSSARDGKSRGLKKRDASGSEDDGDAAAAGWLAQDDGTDDHLHESLASSNSHKSNGYTSSVTHKYAHADIQSLQESAEIAGKIVLLSRGGCGFAEKVKWAQRRGGIALIVGDDVRGEPLVTMYARGDTSNVTIPSLFVSHTTAHLLSGLIPAAKDGSILSGGSAASLEGSRYTSDSSSSNGRSRITAEKPDLASASAAAGSSRLPEPSTPVSEDPRDEAAPAGWFKALFGGRERSSSSDASISVDEPTGWILQSEFEDDGAAAFEQPTKDASQSTSSAAAPGKTAISSYGDGFVIGIQDWRDPDLVAYQKEQSAETSSTVDSTDSSASTGRTTSTAFEGDSITPGSGEYVEIFHGVPDRSESGGSRSELSQSLRESKDDDLSSWLGRFFTSHADDASDARHGKSLSQSDTDLLRPAGRRIDTLDDEPEHHEGLWVTLSPTSMSSSPFFDTLLVLVVSPLVTLTIVYSLLILRSRIRRRRWRAPKSVVERLPVRTYQTMPNTAASTPSETSAVSSPVTASTPLLPSAARNISPRHRPRSRTASGVTIPRISSLTSDTMAEPSPDQIEEKRAAGLSEWRKRYGGKQQECVVCLEEYVDGVSRVMSLPCGHEFHAECITPWLTTRRRTCPICKGDVVRSLARNAGSSSTSPPQATFDGDEDPDEIQEQVAMTRNDDPIAHQPVSRDTEAFEDLEQGMGHDRTR